MTNEKTIPISINGEEFHVAKGEKVLEVVRNKEIYVPGICSTQPDLGIGVVKTCDTCFVEIDGELQRACTTEVKEGMEVITTSTKVSEAQYEAMSRILENHELYCTVCDNNNGNCEVHNAAEHLQIEHQEYEFEPKPYPPDNSHPFYRYEPDQCILCGLCVEACQDLQVSEVLTIDWERQEPRVIWDNDVPIDESSCVSCGHCVSVCPCNALMEKSMLGEAGYMTGMPQDVLEPMINLTKEVEPGYREILTISNVEATMREDRINKTKTVCTYCGVGCSFEVWTKDREILKIQPDSEAPANGVSTCVKGKFGWDFVNSEERLTKPLIRKGEKFVEASWEEALSLIATKMTGIKETHGNDSLGFISSSKCTNEENYLFQKLARSVFGTNNVDNCSRYCQTPASTGLMRTVGIGGDAGTIKDIESSELVLVIGANPAESHPVLATRVKRAQKLNNQKLIVFDLRENELAQKADLFISPKPGTDLVWLNAIAKYIIDQDWHDRTFIENRVNNFDDFVDSLKTYTLDYAEDKTGLSKELLIKVATIIHEAKSMCALWAMGVTQHMGGTDTSTAISNLLLVTGNYGKPGSGGYPLRGHNNVQGASDFGTMPAWLPGYEPVEDDKIRAKYEKAWGTTLPKKPGYNNHQIVEAINDGKVRGMYLFGEEMGLVDSNINYVHGSFEKLDFFVVQDVFFTKTAQFADVVLPAAPSLEKEGTFTNTERRIQRFYQVFDPLGDSKPDWQIFQEIANQLGADWNYKQPGEIMDEAAKLATIFAGVSYDRLEGWNSQLWPVKEDGTDTPLLYKDKFGFKDGKARLFPVEWTPPYEPGEEYDLHLNNGRILEHFHEGNMTYRSKGITHKVPEPWLEVSPWLAEKRGIKTGALVRLKSPYGEAEVRVWVTEQVKGKELYFPMHTMEEKSAVNRLTSSYHDKVTHTPNYKEMSVKMEVIEPKGKSPIPEENHRFGNPQPQIGVEVERKWKREEFTPITEFIRRKGVHHGESDQAN
ncbi:formate dehydrogenase subunit alpha [Halobacillus amylolyticus]|uniref:Formate dehydrogenase subunit alpha n=1 Tax=Halobacillus amylolyticus TaxID=2932259 RepID=A0ABY4HGP2_9BACI|nr:formate dehydrogenase subunit alpha [Halobacillus amylolyticus]UOR14062.1 formate dehydrogenase subunit alpha [Halobacillus amylolyticus]